MCLRKILAREMEGVHKDITNKELAAAINVSPSTLSHFFSGNTEMCFSKYLKAVRYLCPDREKEVMWEIIQVLLKEEQRQPIRYSLEYLSTTNMINELDYVIETQMSAPKENKDWAIVYKLISGYKKGTLRKSELLDEANKLTPKYKETKAMKKFLILYAYLELNVYNLFFDLSKELNTEILAYKQEYVRESYIVRLQEMLCNAYLYAGNDSKKARFFAEHVINSPYVCADFKYNAYYIVGMSYLFENYEECVSNLREYVRRLRLSGTSRVEERISYVINNDLLFAKILWGKDLKDAHTEDILETAHKYIKLGEFDKAAQCLDSYENKNDPFYLCYSGLLNNDPNVILDSLTKLVGKGNKYLANIPATYLRKFGNFSYVADSIMNNIKIA